MKYFYCILLLFSLSIQAQFQLSGIVKDASSNKPLPFASIYISTGMNTISDVDGKFSITTLAPISEFTISYIGYDKKTTLTEKGRSFYQISLHQNTNNLQEVIIPRENPAVAIIRKVIAKKTQNNPLKKLDSFEFKCYNNLVITANPDSISSKIDTISILKNNIKIDSSNYKFKKTVQKQHLFQTEKVSLYQYNGNQLKETILGTKMAAPQGVN